MDKSEVCKLRIEQYSKERESLRRMEWQTFFQLYVGYAAIVAGFTKAQGFSTHSYAICCIGMFATVLLCVTECFLLHEIHQRMRWAGDLKREYFKTLHWLTGFPEKSEPYNGRWWWASLPQFTLATLTMLGVIAWMVLLTME